MRIQFATARTHPGLATDDHRAAGALAARGVRVEPVIWDDESAPSHKRVDAVIIRSCWDYHLREREFSAWLDQLEGRGVTVMNSPSLVRWNLHKRYLRDLESRGVPVVPTILVGSDDARSLGEHIETAGWQETVVKPAVSLSAHETWRVAGRGAAVDDDRFARLRSRGDVLVQRFLPEIIAGGEWSLMFFGTQFSHAVRKRPKTGDFRVQEEHGGSSVLEPPPDTLVAQAERVIRALPHPPVYARIDGVVADDVFMVMEAECIDPVLFFSLHEPAAGHFADRVLDRLTKR